MFQDQNQPSNDDLLTPSSMIAPFDCRENWRQYLDRLKGLPLLPCGAGEKFKAPVEHTTGKPLRDWQYLSFTPDQILAMNDVVSCVGLKPGPEAKLLILDIDGPSAVDFCINKGASFSDIGWTILRNNTDDRLKVVFSVSSELHNLLQDSDGNVIGKSVLTTKVLFRHDSGITEPAEQIELFYGSGQCIVLGEHKSSGGYYQWSGSPSDADDPSAEWLSVIQACLEAKNKGIQSSHDCASEVVQSGPMTPCPICGRDSSSACTTYVDGSRRRVNCFHGQSFAPPFSRLINGSDVPLTAGETVPGRDGTIWAFAKEGFNSSIGSFSTFIEHVDQPQVVNPEVLAGSLTIEGRRPRLESDEILTYLPTALGGVPRLNIRTGDVHIVDQILNGNTVSYLYLRLSSPRASWPKDATADATIFLSKENRFDPVAEYLNGIKCDPLPMDEWERLDQHLLGIEDPIAAKFLPRYFVSAVARVFRPGCDYRQTPVLVGPQWRGKSALGRILFGVDHWIEGVGDLGRDALQKCQTGWGIELAELDGVTRRADQEKLKAFLTETVDTYRAPYDRSPEKHPRRFVFWATSNAPPLRDSSGSTRFVTISIPDKMLPLEWAEQNRDSLWARAVQQYQSGFLWSHGDEAERLAIADRNEDHTEIDPWTDKVIEVLNRNYESECVTIPSLLDQLDIPKERQNNTYSARVRAIAQSQGWSQGRRTVAGKGKRRGLFPPERPIKSHQVHTEDTPHTPCASSRSCIGDTPDIPKHEELSSSEEQQTTSLEQSPGQHSAFGMSGVNNTSHLPSCNGFQGHTDAKAGRSEVVGGVSSKACKKKIKPFRPDHPDYVSDWFD